MKMLGYSVFLLGLITVASAARSTYGISKNCRCGFEKLPGSCRRVDSNEYPADHEHLGITGDCLPDIPDK